MKKALALLAFALAGCSGVSGGHTFLQLHEDSVPQQYIIFAFQRGDVIVELDKNPVAAQHVIELVKQGYYDGSWIYNAMPGGMVQFGEAYWSGREPSPRWLVPLLSQPRTDLAGNEVALPVLAKPGNDTLIVGPQLIMIYKFNLNNRQAGTDMLPIGRVVQGGENLAAARKGDKIISAVIGRNLEADVAK